MNSTETIFYKIGKWILIPVIFVVIWMNIIDPEALDVLPGCLFYQYIKIPCPGCGGTRAFFYLARGEIAKSLFYNPFVAYMAAIYLIFIINRFYRKNISKIQGRHFPIEKCIYVGIAILLIQFLWKLFRHFSSI